MVGYSSVSTITNTIAYAAIALDFELWSMTSADIQRAHLEHFAFLLRASRYRKFNIKVCLFKLNLVRRLLFAMQSAWYPPETVSRIVNALAIVLQAHFSANDAIKPVASYIAANLHSGMCNGCVCVDREIIVVKILFNCLHLELLLLVVTTTTRKHDSYWTRSYHSSEFRPCT